VQLTCEDAWLWHHGSSILQEGLVAAVIHTHTIVVDVAAATVSLHAFAVRAVASEASLRWKVFEACISLWLATLHFMWWMYVACGGLECAAAVHG
jgi:hypothetical protein